MASNEKIENLPRQDHSTTNPKLHALYVRYAQEELILYAEFIERLKELSRVNPSCMAGLIVKERAMLIRSNAAYREAAWRILADDLIPDEDQQFYKEDVVIDSLTSLEEHKNGNVQDKQSGRIDED